MSAIRRVITGERNGHSTVIFDGRAEALSRNERFPVVVSNVFWRAGPGLDRTDVTDGVISHPRLPQGGSQFYVVRIDPHARIESHTTRTVEFHVVVSGEIVCILDDGEVTVRAGDVMVQRGTPHAWENRTDEPWVSIVTMLSLRHPE